MTARAILFFCAAALTAAAAPAHAAYPVAPDVVVICEPTLRHAVMDLGNQFRRETGIPVRVFTSPTPALLEQISHRARSDLVIGEGDGTAEAAVERHLIVAETLERLWRNRLVVAAESLTSNLAALAGKAPIAIVDPWAAVAGTDSEQALKALGLWDAVRSKSIGVVDTADATFLLTTGKVSLALVYATDVTADPSLKLAETLPPGSYTPIVYWAAQTHSAMSANVAKFATYLRQPEAQARVKADGLEVMP